MPALSIAALGAIESLLCGTVAGRMVGRENGIQPGIDRAGLGQHHHSVFRRRSGNRGHRPHQRGDQKRRQNTRGEHRSFVYC